MTMRRLRLILGLSALSLLAACQPVTDQGLTLPTPITAGPTVETTTLTPTSAPTGIPSPQPVTPLPAAPTLSPSPQPPTPSPQPSTPAAQSLSVAYVELGDTLNVRSGPGVDYDVVAELPPDATGLSSDDSLESLITGSTWIWVEGDGVAGWVNSRYLTTAVNEADFCDDPVVETILADLETAIATRDGALLAGLVHPERGLRLRHAWWNNEVFVPGDETAGLFDSDTVYDWGEAGGSGLPLTGPFSEMLLPLLDQDMLPATERACNEILHGPTAGMVILPEAYQPVPFVSLLRPAPGDVAFDWGSWAVGVERWDGATYLSFLVHYAYEI
jgi:hypothetical protein